MNLSKFLFYNSSWNSSWTSEEFLFWGSVVKEPLPKKCNIKGWKLQCALGYHPKICMVFTILSPKGFRWMGGCIEENVWKNHILGFIGQRNFHPLKTFIPLATWLNNIFKGTSGNRENTSIMLKQTWIFYSDTLNPLNLIDILECLFVGRPHLTSTRQYV